MESIECIVIGAGVVGLAVARALARAGHDVLVLEQAAQIGTGVSSRNSEVIHAGIYYRPGSLMARLCVAGRNALYAYCDTHGVGVARCGKLIVAIAAEEEAALSAIAVRAAENGVDDLRHMTGAQARALEPELACTAALLSPSTGIVDTHGFMLALRGDAEDAGATIAFSAPFAGAVARGGGFDVHVGGAAPITLGCRVLVNCASLDAPALAQRIEGLAREAIPRSYLAKGNYFALSGRSPFRRLVYPVPVPGGLGIHLTLDLANQARFGPDVEWIEAIDYAVDPRRALSFYAAVRRYWPALRDDALQTAYSGIRPKITAPGAPPQDFLVQGARDHDIPGLVNLFGIESPGLTASLALADYVLDVAELRTPAA